MKYENVVQAQFLRRPNRFLAHVLVNGVETVVHVKNTGRCRELLVPNCTVWLEKSRNPARKTQYDLIAVEKVTERGTLLINMDAQSPNTLFREWAEKGQFLPNLTLIRPEFTHGDSRFDFYLEQGSQRILVEVKGCTLENDGAACFPDAPTERGVKHIEGLIRAQTEGFKTAIVFVIQMSGMRYFVPNDVTHPAFGEALRRAQRAGVRVLALECHVEPDAVEITGEIPVVL